MCDHSTRIEQRNGKYHFLVVFGFFFYSVCSQQDSTHTLLVASSHEGLGDHCVHTCTVINDRVHRHPQGGQLEPSRHPCSHMAAESMNGPQFFVGFVVFMTFVDNNNLLLRLLVACCVFVKLYDTKQPLKTQVNPFFSLPPSCHNTWEGFAEAVKPLKRPQSSTTTAAGNLFPSWHYFFFLFCR